MGPSAKAKRFSRIYKYGCIACRQRGKKSQCQIHHLNLGGRAGQRRRGDAFTVGLCPWHHQGACVNGSSETAMTLLLGPSLALNSKMFRATFGTDDELLAMQNELVTP